jgi:hypothetical protein
MAFIGTPLDTRNTFQSLVGKRFNGDGSTTAFTLDVAPSSTLDIEVFVGNVRQDPNSAYTLSGTTLTFTGAPPSGTNNIYVVHQAKSVGTIDVPSSFLSDAQTFSGALSLTGGLDSRGGAVFNEGSADEDFRIESNGNTHQIFVDGGNDRVIVGSDTSVTADSLQPSLQINGTTEATSAVGIHRASNDSGGAQLIFSKTRNTSVGGNTVINNGDTYGEILFLGNDGSDLASAGAKIAGISSSAPGSNDMPSSITFSTTANAASSFSERMRVDSEGKVLIGTTTVFDMDDTNNGIQFVGPSDLVQLSRNNNAAFAIQRTGNDGRVAQFYRDTTERGYIEVDGSSTTYATSSDYRLKENIVDLDNAITRLKQLKPRRFNFIGQEDTRDGFVAHEVTAVPEAISGTKDEVDADNKPVYQGIDQSKIVPLLTAALQEAVTRIETLEAKVKALEEA